VRARGGGVYTYAVTDDVDKAVLQTGPFPGPIPKPGKLDPATAEPMRAGLTEDKFAGARILMRAVEAGLVGRVGLEPTTGGL